MAGLFYIKAGVPCTLAGTTVNPAAVEVWTWSNGSLPYLPRGGGNVAAGGVTNWFHFENTGTGAIVLSFTEADATAGVGISVAAGARVDLHVECDRFYTKSVAAETFVAVGMIRRG